MVHSHPGQSVFTRVYARESFISQVHFSIGKIYSRSVLAEIFEYIFI